MKNLADKILIYLKHQEAWVNGAQIERSEFRHDKKGTLYKPSTIGRCLRKLHELYPEKVERQMQGKSVAYKYIFNSYETFHMEYQRR